MFENMETRSLMEVDGGGIVTGPVIQNHLVLRVLAWIVSRM